MIISIYVGMKNLYDYKVNQYVRSDGNQKKSLVSD